MYAHHVGAGLDLRSSSSAPDGRLGGGGNPRFPLLETRLVTTRIDRPAVPAKVWPVQYDSGDLRVDSTSVPCDKAIEALVRRPLDEVMCVVGCPQSNVLGTNAQVLWRGPFLNG